MVSSIIFWMAFDCLAAPSLNIPTNLTVSSNQVVIPINISGVSGAGIVGYALRIDYDNTWLSNPVAILDDTLSEGKDVQTGPPQDGLGGEFIITLFSGFTASEDGVLVKLQLTVDDENFTSTDVSFITAKTSLYNASYQKITYTSSDGVLVKFESGYETESISIGKKDAFEITSSEDGDLKLETNSFDGNGFVLAAHDNDAMEFDIIPNNGYDRLLSREWYIDVHGNTPETVTLTFTIPEVTEPVLNYGLLATSDNSSASNYEEIVKSTAVIGDTIIFQLSSDQLIEKQFYTVGVKYRTEDKAICVPTLNEWGMILFAGLLMLISVALIKQSRISI